jgi:LysR family transcriptional regulator, nitrogen assimilation regulatory protein
MNLRQLRYFLSIAELRSFTRAAEVLHIAQPALSRQVRMIEDELGTQLFVRFDRGVTLTEAGELLRDRASDLLRQFDELRNDVISGVDEPRGELAVGMPPSMREMITGPLVDAYCRSHSQVTLHIQEGISVDLSKLIQDGKLDCAVIVILSEQPISKIEPFVREQLFLVGPPEGSLELDVPVTLEQVSAKPMILTSRPNSLRLVLENALGHDRLPLNLVADGNSTEMMIELVGYGLACSVLPYCAIRNALQRGTLSAAPISDLWIDWGFITPNHRGVSTARQAFKTLLFEQATQRIESKEWLSAVLA